MFSNLNMVILANSVKSMCVYNRNLTLTRTRTRTLTRTR